MSSTFTDRPPDCPGCDGPGQFLGTRGGADHWLCRCGLQYTTPAAGDPPEDPWDGCDEW